MPPEVVREAIVNAVAHRDYTSNGSVQVMLFSDRLEVWNPGTLPPSLTLEKLRHPHGSVPGNPLLAESLYLTKYIERMGTGTGDMIARCRKVGLKEPQFKLTDGFVITLRRKPARAFEAVGGKTSPRSTGQVTGQVTEQVAGQVTRQLAVAVLKLCQNPQTAKNIQFAVGIKHRGTFLQNYLNPLLSKGWIARTIPGKPNSRLQKYKLTVKGRVWLDRKK